MERALFVILRLSEWGERDEERDRRGRGTGERLRVSRAPTASSPIVSSHQFRCGAKDRQVEPNKTSSAKQSALYKRNFSHFCFFSFFNIGLIRMRSTS